MTATRGAEWPPPMRPSPPLPAEPPWRRAKTVAVVILVVLLFIGIGVLVLEGLARASAGGGCGGG